MMNQDYGSVRELITLHQNGWITKNETTQDEFRKIKLIKYNSILWRLSCYILGLAVYIFNKELARSLFSQDKIKKVLLIDIPVNEQNEKIKVKEMFKALRYCLQQNADQLKLLFPISSASTHILINQEGDVTTFLTSEGAYRWDPESKTKELLSNQLTPQHAKYHFQQLGDHHQFDEEFKVLFTDSYLVDFHWNFVTLQVSLGELHGQNHPTWESERGTQRILKQLLKSANYTMRLFELPNFTKDSQMDVASRIMCTPDFNLDNLSGID